MRPTATQPGGWLRHFSRRTSSGGFLPILDGLRFIAIALVVLTHVAVFAAYERGASTSRLAHLLDQGTFGVNIFFVISGFILATPFAAARLGLGAPVALRRYYLRRLTRLEPPYIVALLGCTALLIALDHSSPRLLAPHLAAGLGYAHSLVYGEYNPINRVTWTLEIEIQFYVLVPALTAVFLIRDVARRRTVIAALAAGSIALYRYLLHGISGSFGLTIFGYLAYFLAGFLLADLYLVRWKGMPASARRWDVVWLLGAPILLFDLDHGAYSGWLAPALTFVLFVAAFRGGLARKLLTNPYVFTVGGMCYSIYLLHFVVIERLYPWTSQIALGRSLAVTWLVQLLLLSPPVLVISGLYFVLIERPCMNPSWPADAKRTLFAAVVSRRPAANGGRARP